LIWTDNSDNETAFVIQRSFTEGSGYTDLVQTAANGTTYPDQGLEPNTTYYYRVQAINAEGGSEFSYASGKTANIAPAAPSGLQITDKTATTIDLAWTDTSNNETGLVLEKSFSESSGFDAVTETPANITAFQDDELSPN